MGAKGQRWLGQIISLCLVALFCLGSATTQRVQKEEPVEWLIYLDDPSLKPKKRCTKGPEVVTARGSLPPQVSASISFRLHASRPQPLEAFEHQLQLAAASWCYNRVNVLRAEMVEGEFLAEQVYAVVWLDAQEN